MYIAFPQDVEKLVVNCKLLFLYYMSWNAKYEMLMRKPAIIRYCSGLLIVKFSNDAKKAEKELLIALCIVVNLGILAIFNLDNRRQLDCFIFG